jgi:hypothetical protein
MVRRTLLRGVTRRELWHGNRERLSNLVNPNREKNIILWAWTTHQLNRRRYVEAFSAPEWSDKNLVRLRSPAETRRFFSTVR